MPEVNHALENELAGLWLRAMKGDDAAYAEALKVCAAHLRRYFGIRLGYSATDIEDLVQETLLALHSKRGTYDASYPVSSWVYGIGQHKLVDVYRRQGRRKKVIADNEEESALQVAGVEHDATAGHDLRKLLGLLPVAQQQAIVLTKIDGLSLEEAAAHTGASVAALKVQVHRGLKKLADLIGSKP